MDGAGDLRKFFDDEDPGVFAQAVRHARLPLILSDPTDEDHCIVFANDAFLELTGYDRDEVVGRNCRFLQGEDTSQESVDRIRESIANETVSVTEIVNYRKDGSRFVNALQIGPIYDEDGKIRLFFGSQVDVTDTNDEAERLRTLHAQELRHRLLNIVNVLGVIVRMTGREDMDETEKLRRIDERIRNVGTAHLRALTSDGNEKLTMQSLTETILEAYAPNGSENFQLDGPELVLGSTEITPLSLLLHELSTNAVKHGAFSEADGTVSLAWIRDRTAGTLSLTWEEAGGPEVAAPVRESGSRLIRDVFKASGGSVDYDWHEDGLVASATLRVDE